MAINEPASGLVNLGPFEGAPGVPKATHCRAARVRAALPYRRRAACLYGRSESAKAGRCENRAVSIVDDFEFEVPDCVRSRIAWAVVKQAILDIGDPVHDSTEWWYTLHAARWVKTAGLKATEVYTALFNEGALDMNSVIESLLTAQRGRK